MTTAGDDIEVGTLVNFNGGPFPQAAERYSCPGIVIDDASNGLTRRQCLTVMWSDGRITREWNIYLNPAK